jgi:hypothetical protein
VENEKWEDRKLMDMVHFCSDWSKYYKQYESFGDSLATKSSHNWPWSSDLKVVTVQVLQVLEGVCHGCQPLQDHCGGHVRHQNEGVAHHKKPGQRTLHGRTGDLQQFNQWSVALLTAVSWHEIYLSTGPKNRSQTSPFSCFVAYGNNSSIANF